MDLDEVFTQRATGSIGKQVLICADQSVARRITRLRATATLPRTLSTVIRPLMLSQTLIRVNLIHLCIT
jgi:hypothetical protein